MRTRFSGATALAPAFSAVVAVAWQSSIDHAELAIWLPICIAMLSTTLPRFISIFTSRERGRRSHSTRLESNSGEKGKMRHFTFRAGACATDHWDKVKSPTLLVEQICELESAARSALATENGARRRTLFELRAEMCSTGLWTDADVQDFYQAMRVRNAIVHGDCQDLTWKQIEIGQRILSKLLSKLEVETKIPAREVDR
jgi:hypothetical protein